MLVPVQRCRDPVHRSRLTLAERLDRVVQTNASVTSTGRLFDSLLEASALTGLWRIDYKNNRRHSRLGQQTGSSDFSGV
jgi:hypothetical protein